MSTILLAITGAFGGGRRGGGGGGGRGGGGSPTRDEGVLNKWLNWLADALKRLAGKAVEALPAIVGSVVDAI